MVSYQQPRDENEDSAVWIMELRRRAGMTQIDLAEHLDISVGAVTAWETQRTRPGKRTQHDLQALGESYDMPTAPIGTKSRTHSAIFPDDLTERFERHFSTNPITRNDPHRA